MVYNNNTMKAFKRREKGSSRKKRNQNGVRLTHHQIIIGKIMSAAIEQRNQDATCYVGNLDERVHEELLWELMLQAVIQ